MLYLVALAVQLEQLVVVDQLAAGQVQQRGVLAEVAQVDGAHDVLGGGHEGDVQGDVVAALEEGLHAVHVLHAGVEEDCGTVVS